MLKTITYQNKERQLILIVMGIMLIRAVFLFVMGPMPQDAYYFLYSQHLALSYFDHPPMIAYALSLFTAVLGKSVVAIKLADSVITILTVLFFYKLSKCFLGPRQLNKAMLLLLSTFMVTILSLISTPDVPLLMFWALSLYLIYQAVFNSRNVYWIWAGISMGLTFDSKYTAIFIPAGLILFLILSDTYRKKFLSIWFWLAVLSFFITVLPVIIWNVQHDFASFKFQSTSRMNDPGMHLQIKYFLGLLGHQSFILMPILLGAIVYYIFRVLKSERFNPLNLDARKQFLLCFSVPMILCFVLVSFFSWVKLNWIMPAYLTAIILVSMYLSDKWIRVQVLLSAFIHVLLAFEIIFYPVPVKSDDTWYGWNSLSDQVSTLQKKFASDFVFSVDTYKTSAELNLYSNQFVYGQNILGQNALQFDYVNNDLTILKGKSALFIDSQPQFKDVNKSNQENPELLKFFSSVTELPPIILKKGNRPVRKFFVYLCTDYHPKQ
jgi:4-amino-4-deoxy-L-arabinose transferase-like glycosyltransferase